MRFNKLNNEIDKLGTEIEDIESGRLYENALEWRFEFPEVLNDDGDFVGFDVVIGNPPYGVNFDRNYETSLINCFYQCKKIPDSYCFFILQGLNLLRANRSLSYIVPNTFCDLEKGDEFRKFLLTEYVFTDLFQSGWIFESAIVDTLIIFLKKCNPFNSPDKTISIKVDSQEYKRETNDFLNNFLVKIDYRNLPETNKVKSKIIANSILLGEIAEIKAGVKMYEKGKGIPPQDSVIISEQPYSKRNICPEGWMTLYRGKDIHRYYLIPPNEFVDYGLHLAAPRNFDLFHSPKILMRRTDDRLISCLETESAICVNSCHVIKLKHEYADKYSYKFVLGLLNSRLMQYIFEIQNPQMTGKIFAEIKVVYVERLPIVNDKKINKVEIENLVDEILAAKKGDRYADTSELEKAIDHLVYKLYQLTYDEVKIIEPEFALTEQEYRAIVIE
jgi:hypothetical protein